MRNLPLSSALPLAALAIALATTGCGKPKSERKLDQLDAQLLANQSDAALTGTLADQIVVDPAKAGKPAAAAAKPAMTAVPAPAAKPAPAPVASVSAASAPSFAKVPPPIGPAPQPATPPAAAAAAGPTLGELARAQAVAPKPVSAAAVASKPVSPAAVASKPVPAAPVATAAKAPVRPADVGPVSGECYANLGYGKGWAAKLPTALPVYPGATLGEAAGNETHGCAVRIVSFSTREPWRKVSDWYRARATKAGWDADADVRSGAHVVAGTAADGSAFYLTLAPADGGGTAADMIVSLGH